MNRKLLIGGGAAILFVWGVLPGLFAGSVETAIREQLANPELLSRVNVEIVKLEKGWFSTDLVLRIDGNRLVHFASGERRRGRHSHDGSDEDGHFVTIGLNLRHGPFLMTQNGPRIGLAGLRHDLTVGDMIMKSGGEWPEAFFANMALPNLALRTSVIVGFGGGVTIVQDIPTIEFEMPIEGKMISFDWGGYEGYFTYDSESDEISFDVDIPRFRLATEDSVIGINVAIDDIALNGDMRLGDDFIWTGSGTYRLGGLLVSGKAREMPAVDIRNVAVTSTIDWQDEERLGGEGLVTIEYLRIAENDGRPVEFGPARMAFDVRNISAEAYSTFNRLRAHVAAGRRDAEDRIRLRTEGLERGFEAARALIRAGIEFNIEELAVTLPQGSVNYHHQAGFPEGTELPEGISKREAAAALNYNGSFAIDEGLLRMIAEHDLRGDLGDRVEGMSEEQLEQGLANTITQYEALGYLKRDNGRYTADITFEDGVLEVNGQEVTWDHSLD